MEGCQGNDGCTSHLLAFHFHTVNRAYLSQMYLVGAETPMAGTVWSMSGMDKTG